jgi:2-haloacid dehalogenase
MRLWLNTPLWKCMSIVDLVNGRHKDVKKALLDLKEKDEFELYLFSNGTEQDLYNLLERHEVFKSVFDREHVVSVDGVRAFKPSPASYNHLLARAGKTGDPSEVILVSSNPFDICGSRNAGLRALWIDRTYKGWKDQLGNAPTWIMGSLSDLSIFNATKS